MFSSFLSPSLSTFQEKISGLFAAIRSVYKLGGARGFFRGLQARVVYQMPSTAICWSTYEFFKYLLSVDVSLPTLGEDSTLSETSGEPRESEPPPGRARNVTWILRP